MYSTLGGDDVGKELRNNVVEEYMIVESSHRNRNPLQSLKSLFPLKRAGGSGKGRPRKCVRGLSLRVTLVDFFEHQGGFPSRERFH